MRYVCAICEGGGGSRSVPHQKSFHCHHCETPIPGTMLPIESKVEQYIHYKKRVTELEQELDALQQPILKYLRSCGVCVTQIVGHTVENGRFVVVYSEPGRDIKYMTLEKWPV